MKVFLNFMFSDQCPLDALFLEFGETRPVLVQLFLVRTVATIGGYDDRQCDRQRHNGRSGEERDDFACQRLGTEVMERREQDMPRPRENVP